MKNSDGSEGWVDEAEVATAISKSLEDGGGSVPPEICERILFILAACITDYLRQGRTFRLRGVGCLQPLDAPRQLTINIFNHCVDSPPKKVVRFVPSMMILENIRTSHESSN